MKRFLLFAPIFLLLAACSHSTDTTLNGGTSTNSGAWIVPGVGTEYVFESSPPDTAGLGTLTVSATGQHIGGKTNVVELQATHSSGILFYNLEPNGDFSFGDTNIVNGQPQIQWDTYQTGSHGTIIEAPAVDTVENGDRIVSSDVRSFMGTENLTVPAGTFLTDHIREISINGFFSPDSLMSSTDTDFSDIWFAPSTGMYIKFFDQEDNNGTITVNASAELIQYIPK